MVFEKYIDCNLFLDILITDENTAHCLCVSSASDFRYSDPCPGIYICNIEDSQPQACIDRKGIYCLHSRSFENPFSSSISKYKHIFVIPSAIWFME